MASLHHRLAVIVVALPRIGEREVVARHVREAAEVDAVVELLPAGGEALVAAGGDDEARRPPRCRGASAATARSRLRRSALRCVRTSAARPAFAPLVQVSRPRSNQPLAKPDEPARREPPAVVGRASPCRCPRKSASSRSMPQRPSPRSASQVGRKARPRVSSSAAASPRISARKAPSSRVTSPIRPTRRRCRSDGVVQLTRWTRDLGVVEEPGREVVGVEPVRGQRPEHLQPADREAGRARRPRWRRSPPTGS